jgi:tetratricopeptide (TPR) repeat protein
LCAGAARRLQARLAFDQIAQLFICLAQAGAAEDRHGGMMGRVFLRAGALCAFALAAAALGRPAAADCSLGVMADLPVTMTGERATIPVRINGKETRFWLDSGAFFSFMSKAQTVELGLKVAPAPAFGFYVTGIGGDASVDMTTIKSFGLLNSELHNVDFLVGGSDTGGSLIGANILAIGDTEFDLAHGSVKLIKPHGCGNAALAYWAPGKPFFTAEMLPPSGPLDHSIRVHVRLNDANVIAEMDTGSPTSMITRKAAERAGVNLAAPDLTPIYDIGGIGAHYERGWIVPIAKVSVGDEDILRVRLETIDGKIDDSGDEDMLLGADFILAHHIYVARGQERIYFTYSGGRPFLTRDGAAAPANTAPLALPAGAHVVQALDTAAAPKTAEDFARRGDARLAQLAFDGAIADLTEAIRLDPAKAGYYKDRATAYGESGKGAEAWADVDKALALDPNEPDMLRYRVIRRLSDKDRKGALADAEAAARLTPPASLKAAEIANLLVDLGEPAQAIPLLDAVIDAHPDDVRLGSMLNARCWARATAKVDLDKALVDCNRAIKRDGGPAGYIDSRGMVYFRKGDFASAVADYDTVLKREPDLAPSQYMRGLAKIAMGQVDAGKADTAAALAKRPDLADEYAAFGIGR